MLGFPAAVVGSASVGLERAFLTTTHGAIFPHVTDKSLEMTTASDWNGVRPNRLGLTIVRKITPHSFAAYVPYCAVKAPGKLKEMGQYSIRCASPLKSKKLKKVNDKMIPGV